MRLSRNSFLAVALLLWTATATAAPWQPVVGAAFPDVEWRDASGGSVRLSAYRGQVLLVEFVAMSCSACQAFSGAHERGAYGKAKPQKGLQSIEQYLRTYSGVRLGDPRLRLVQVIVQDHSGKEPSAHSLKDWTRHFGFNVRQATVVGAPAGMQNLPVPAFYLIDADFKLRRASTNSGPHDLYRELLPAVRDLIGAGGNQA